MTPPTKAVAPPIGYLGAVGVAGLATAGLLALGPALRGGHPFAAYWLAVLLSARSWGVGPAALAVALGSLLAGYFFLDPGHSLRVADPADRAELAAFGVAGLATAWVAGRGRAGPGRRGDGDRLRTTLDSIADGVIVADAGGRVESLNPVAERLLGWASAEAAGRPLADVFRLVDERSGAPIEGPAPRALREGSALGPARDALLVARDGSTRPVDDSVAAIEGRDGEVTGMVVVFRDVTRRRLADRALREGEERLRLAQEAAAMGHWDYDIPTRRVAWSPGLEAIHGLPPGSFAGTFDAFLADIHPEDRDRVARTVARTVEEGRDHLLEYRFLHPDGGVRWVEGRGKLFRDPAGRPARLIGVCLDVTRRKDEEEAHREADRRKDEFLATLAHELRNPLAPIRTGLQILKHTEGDNPAVEPLRAMMQRQAEHLARLVDDLVDLSRFSRGTIELRKEVVGLASIVGQAVASARSMVDDRGHELAVTLPGGDRPVEVDPARLEQILANLLSNAAKYTDPGGRIGLDARVEGGEVVLRVSDTGIGIAPGMLGRVFDVFVQVERRLDRSQGGLGIGLSLVKRLAEMHGGTVEARSEGPGRGSEFVVRLPAGPDGGAVAPPPGPPAVAATAPGPPRRRVLVVDDNEDAADSLGRYLGRVMGQEVEVAYDGPGALERAATFRPEVVLLDIGLPGMSGYEVAERLREGPGTARATLIALTGWGQDEDRRRSRAAGIDVHLVKPVDPDALRDLLMAPGLLDMA